MSPLQDLGFSAVFSFPIRTAGTPLGVLLLFRARAGLLAGGAVTAAGQASLLLRAAICRTVDSAADDLSRLARLPLPEGA